MKRRDLIVGAAALPIMASIPIPPFAEARGKPWNGKSRVIDAMGELREVYVDSLVQEMLDSGIRSITVTLCDPKLQGRAAYDATIEGILDYNRFLGLKPRFYSIETSVAGIAKAVRDGKMAVFYLA